ncbi:MAG: penicillin-binding transpeptidase domain-containing protein [Peptostreptococcaceae bacterium]|nr:penicillin-binding transpeptidase domain-containing protein [Peptostreptococcaceae bacterium]
MNRIKEQNESRVEIRSKIMYAVMCIFFVMMMLKAVHVSIIKGNIYADIAKNTVYRKIIIDAPRGEIRDRHGTLLAGNREAFSVEIYPGNMQSQDLNRVISSTIDILKKNKEEIIDEFPIVIENGQYEFTYDQNVAKWKKSNEIPLDFTAEQTFDYIVEILARDGAISVEPGEDKNSIQSKIIDAGYYPPISVKHNEFTEIVKKREFIDKYLYRFKEDFGGDKEKMYQASAKDVFGYMRKYYDIDESMNDSDARRILNIRTSISQKGYYQYEPTLIAKDIKKDTVAKIEENSINLRGVGIVASSVRYYPMNNHASHILGQLGKISSQAEIDKYVKEQNYLLSDIIGKTGVEKSFEKELNGKKGFTQVRVDVGGRLIETLGREDSKAGDTLYLTIDSKLQKVAEDSLKKTLTTIQNGGYYDSVWGNMRMRDNRRVYSKAQSGAVVVMDVKTGDILAMASYPDFNPNLFVQGISSKDFASLTPANLNDQLAPKPLYNIATMTTVAPGSTFKMITGLTGIELGLSPHHAIYDKGYIEMGGKYFGCWLWNQQRGSHGPENLMDALRDSCNFYFYSVATGYDYAAEKNLPINIKAQDILDYSERFGLNEKSGVEIEEIAGEVPSIEEKIQSKKRELKSVLLRLMKNYFEGITPESDKYEEKVDTIISWMEENPSRSEIVTRLENLGVKSEYVNKVTDLVKYSYFNLAKWQTGDSFNMSIGQGYHKYSPIQMARYVSAIANDGYLNKANIVSSIESADKLTSKSVEKVSKKIELRNHANLTFIRQGMEDVTDEGSASNYFKSFPIKVASKTGTAQKTGRIPVADEEAYLLQYMGNYGVDKEEVIALTDKLEKEDKNRLKRHIYMQRAILELNPNMTPERIHQYKDEYDPFAWFVSYAPAEKPEIAVVTLLFQGGHGGFGSAIARDVYAEYFNLEGKEATDNNFTFNDYIG